MTVNTSSWCADLKSPTVASVKSELCQYNGGMVTLLDLKTFFLEFAS